MQPIKAASRDLLDETCRMSSQRPGEGGNEVIGQEPLTGPVPLFHVN